MTALAWAARMGLAGVFVVAAVAKWRDRDGTYGAARDFGLPSNLAKIAALLLAPVEAVLAVTLVPAMTAPVAGAVAAVLLTAFTAAIARAVASGRQVACSCFGSASSRPVGWPTLVRNAVMLAMAVMVAVLDPPTASQAVGTIVHGTPLVVTAVVLLAIVAGVEGWWLVVVLRRHGQALIRLAALDAGSGPTAAPQGGLAVGSTAPAFELLATSGESVSLAALLLRGPALLVFTSPHCPACTTLLPEIVEQTGTRGSPQLVLLGAGSLAANRLEAQNAGAERILLDRRGTVAATYFTVGTPSAVLIAADGTVASTLAQGTSEVRALAAAAVALLTFPRVEAVSEVVG